MGVDNEFHAPGDPERTAYVLEVARENLPDGLNGISVLDLACRTGAFGRAFAEAGASKVLGIEGKEHNYHQIPHVKGADYVLGDVRNLVKIVMDRSATELFDVTLCLGILYHLDADDAIELLHDMRLVTSLGGIAIIDTHIGSDTEQVEVDGERYRGSWYDEGVPGPWSSLGNPRSFWFTPDALRIACFTAGWSQVTQLEGVRWPGEPAGRHWLVLS